MTELCEKGTKTVSSWSFDKPCETMEWSAFAGDRITLENVVSEQLDSSLQNANVVLFGIQGPEKEENDNEEEEEEKEMAPPVLDGQAKIFDDKYGGVLTQVLMESEKTFKHGSVLGSTTPVVRLVSNGKIQKILFVGLGPKKGTDESATDKPNISGQKVGSTVAKSLADEKGIKTAILVMPSGFETSYNDVASSFYTQLYSDVRFKGLEKNAKLPAEGLTTVELFVEDSPTSLDSEIAAGASLARGIYLTKDIVNAPHNILNSHGLANTARRIAEESGGSISCQILGKEEIEARGMGAFLAVARGSETDPQLIHLTYKPESGENLKKVGLVGKGLLFDTGGYNIKTGMMELMKFDCGGSAAVLGAARAIGALKPEGVEAHFVVAACENMINARAYVPSDILTAANGKTIEVMNTDAEGRLTLADALVFTDKELGCEAIVELSTLTGACMVSLGLQMAGVWTANDELASQLDACSKATGDKTWRMPLAEEYRELLKSKFADMKNLGTRYGGAITAALFLTEFVSKKKPFAHIDIAGPAWADATGATGFGCRLVTEWVTKQGIKERQD